MLLLTLAAHVLAPSRVWVALLLTLGGALLVGYFWARSLAARVEVTRQQRYGWVHVGDLLEEKFCVHNRSFLTIVWIEIDDNSNLPGYSARTVRFAEARSSVQWRSEGVCLQRGMFALGPWQARMADPFGFFEVTLSYRQTRSILVYPPLVALPRLLLPRGALVGTGRTGYASRETTTNASGVREHTPGDSLSRVHWRSTARLDTLMVKTFDLEPSGDLWIVLDLDASVQAGEGAESTEEYAVILAASLAGHMLNQNRSVGLVAYGTVLQPGRKTADPLPLIVAPHQGQAQQVAILQALATVRAGGQWPLARVLAEMDQNLGRGMTLAVITPSCDSTWPAGLLLPMRRGIAPSVILVDPNSFGRPANVDRLAGLLANLGVPCHRISKGMPFQPLVRHKRIGRAEYRVLSATGRVIEVDG